uniref:Synaptotagmin 9 n=1 Tax=Rousettus aegyptiacus TaxID=9407 RepID=A0A7J8H891_ROUAE|nr:synaptotagmin 9 [Rousettus aegyptiacus]
MPGARDALCHQALQLLAELCARGAVEHESCQDFIYHLRDRSRPRLRDPDISVSLLTLVVTACGLALFGVSLFVSWKLCWVPWRERGLFSGSKDNNQEPLNTDTETNEQENSEGFLDPPSPCPDSSMKISHTSPDIPLSTQLGGQENCAHGVRVQRQVTEPTSSTRSVIPTSFLNARQGPPCPHLSAVMALSSQGTCHLFHIHLVSEA